MRAFGIVNGARVLLLTVALSSVGTVANEPSPLEALKVPGVRIQEDIQRNLVGVSFDDRRGPIDPDLILQVQGLEECVDIEIQGKSFSDEHAKRIAACKRLTSVRIFSTSITAAGIAELSKRKQLNRLSLHNTKIGDDAIAKLLDLPLLSLDLTATAITDDSLKTLAELKTLQTLGLSQTAVTDEGVEQLVALRDLRYISLYRSETTLKSLASLSKLPLLESVELQGTPETLRDIALIRELKTVHSLRIDGVRIDDRAMAHLAALPKLKVLTISQAKLTAIGVAQLKVLRELTMLNLPEAVEADAVKELQAARPRLEIYVGGFRFKPAAD